jgi:hypothetical protein
MLGLQTNATQPVFISFHGNSSIEAFTADSISRIHSIILHFYPSLVFITIYIILLSAYCLFLPISLAELEGAQ